MQKPAMVALIKLESVPAKTAFIPKRATSLRRFGAIPLNHPVICRNRGKVSKSTQRKRDNHFCLFRQRPLNPLLLIVIHLADIY